MNKKLTCIECPLSCPLSVEMEGGRVTKVEGNKCPKGVVYARSEIEEPSRVLTSAVLGHGLGIKMVPVRTDKAIPKGRLLEAMEQVKKVKLRNKVRAGDVVIRDLLGLGVNLIVTRDAP